MNPKVLSGAQKRKEAKQREDERKKQSGALNSFFQRALLKENETDTEKQNTIELNISNEENGNKEENINRNLGEEKINGNVEEEAENIPSNDQEASSSHSTKFPSPKDVALWPQIITPELRRQFLIEKPPSVCGRLDTLKTIRQEESKTITRSLTEKVFFRSKANGETVRREWLVYSSSSGCVYCYVCKLFSNKKNTMTEGYKDWKNIHRSLSEHENSKVHMLSVGTLVSRSSTVCRIDTNLESQYQNERKYWREVLKRIIATIKYVAKHGLAFRGSHQSLFTAGNGNYLGALEYLSEFDGFLASHLQKYFGKGKGSVSYLSATVCDEFLVVIQDEVKTKLINEVKSAKYISIIVDSTPDVSHVDQLTIVLRYVVTFGDFQ